jgi:phosphatidylserine decarboxylase
MPRTGEPIEVFNRYTSRIEREPIYGERWLRWTYDTTAGRLVLALFVRRVWFSRFYGWRMSRPASARRIAPFLEHYQLDASEFAQPPETFV